MKQNSQTSGVVRSGFLPAIVLATLGLFGPAGRADTISWTGWCGDEHWHTCCEIDIGGESYWELNWNVPPTPWPNCPALPDGDDDVVIGGANVTLTGGGSANTLTAGGVFTLSNGSLSIITSAVFDGLLQWDDGSITGNGATPAVVWANGGAALVGNAGHTIRTATFNNPSVTILSGAGHLYLGNRIMLPRAVFENMPGATFDVQTDADSLVPSTEGGVFNNAGLFLKSGGGLTLVKTEFNNTGTAQVQAGTLEIAAGGTSTGTFQVDPTTTLVFNYSGQYLVDTAQITGTGLERIATGGVTINSPAVISVPFLDLEGRLRGTGELQITDTLNWTSGGMDGSGTTTVGPAASANVGSGTSISMSSNRVHDNYGSVLWGNVGNFYINSGAVLNNLAGATFDVETDADIIWSVSPYGTINSAGLFVKSAAAARRTSVRTSTTRGRWRFRAGRCNFPAGSARPRVRRT